MTLFKYGVKYVGGYVCSQQTQYGLTMHIEQLTLIKLHGMRPSVTVWSQHS